MRDLEKLVQCGGKNSQKKSSRVKSYLRAFRSPKKKLWEKGPGEPRKKRAAPRRGFINGPGSLSKEKTVERQGKKQQKERNLRPPLLRIRRRW